MLLLAPVAQGISGTAEDYPYSSANLRYKASVTKYAGFSKSVPKDNPALSTGLTESVSVVVPPKAEDEDKEKDTPPSTEETAPPST